MPLQEQLTTTALPASRLSKPVIEHFNIISSINLGLLALGAALVLYYVLSANGLAAGNYRITSLREDLSKASGIQTELASQASDLENSDAIKSYALSHEMVPSKDTTYLFENGDVALIR